ncbi:MAG: SocA family protein [Desulfobulbaceae bacterium]|nr:SocA family protein [Desulfobulbaceae bacterium]
MSATFDFPWNQYATITELAVRLEHRSPQFGKTVLQKIVYLLQTLFNVDCGYNYTLYYYGPYAADLLTDLDYVQNLGGIKILEMERGIRILPGEKHQELCNRAKPFLNASEEGIEKVVSEFGDLTAKELELIATIVYADREVNGTGVIYSHLKFINLIQGIKPGFSQSEIEKNIKVLEDVGHIAIRQ